eukprot:166149-Prorocentrum_minimum.AAC.1
MVHSRNVGRPDRVRRGAWQAGGAAKTFKCNSCKCEFTDVKAHREHHKTDWHRLNLKRKVHSVVKSSFPFTKGRMSGDIVTRPFVN